MLHPEQLVDLGMPLLSRTPFTFCCICKDCVALAQA